MSLAMQVLQHLAAARAAEQGAEQFVSGATLASAFAVTRSAIWKSISTLRELGTEVQAVTHRGYRLALPSSPLDAGGVIAQLRPSTRAKLRDGHCRDEIASTNTALLERGAPPAGRFDFLTAENQSAGRGRRGRSWLAPPGGAICLSWSWCFEGMTAQLGALSLATGIAAVRALASLGVNGVQLKWPNDLVTPQGKLGGILIEIRSEAAGPVHVVVGIGLNVAVGQALRERIDASGNTPVDLASLAGGAPPHRNALVAALLDQGIGVLEGFTEQGFAPLLGEYQAADALAGRHVQIHGGHGPTQGIARGVDADGALRVEHEGRIHRIIAGEISIRTGT